ncbi:serine/threonine-protein phosphatase 4 regulatory subunit 1-like isoform X2 [Hippopotamus amphibius kiboko]|uniref:serine/threonine-protein phosphatase 4 regulatory subunit 1-like isoform X2 n=1 Tax=Hippopotamus amphibius kiboko TaxID=575201 RepID=UPI00259A2ED5|nr:serine/threonine-protein phosphatase 4 regulatory subunit 1-like isoform X2 [Hippopotamus amphibius kiboko]
MAWEPGARARRRPKLRKERPGPARASPGAAAAARPNPGRGARRSGGRLFAGPGPGPSVASRAGPASAAGTVPRVPERHRCRHLGTPAGSPDLPAHLGSHLLREGGAGRRREALGDARARGGAGGEGAGPETRCPAPLPPAPPLAHRPRLQAHPKMAEMPLYFVDLQDDLDDYGFEDYGPDCDSMRVTAFLDIPGQDNLPPLARLEKYAFSGNVFNRQIIARGLLDVFRDFSNNEEDFITVMEILVRLSEDAEPTVRTELMEQIPPIAIFLQENRSDFPVVLSEYLIPIVVTYLTDPNNQMICKLAPVLSKSAVERLLLPRFCELCSDGKLFQARKVCATNFGDICHAVGQEATETFLLPKFAELCSDGVWGMRKACAECFLAVSHSTSPEVRRARLSPLFITLISDPCRWVRQAAFQSLGPFISTFANPSRAGLYVREDGTLSIRPPALDVDSDFSPGSLGAGSRGDASSACSTKPGQTEPALPTEGTSMDTSNCPRGSGSSSGLMESPVEDSVLAGAELTGHSAEATKLPIKSCPGPDSWACLGSPEDIFSSFLYWRTPLPDISKDLELLVREAGPQEEGSSTPGPACSSYVAQSEIQRVLDSLQEHMMNDPDVQAQVQVLSAALRAVQLDSGNEAERQATEGLNEVSISGPSPASDGRTAPAAASPQSELSVARILQSTGPGRPDTGASDRLETAQRHGSSPLDRNNSKLQDVIPQPLLDQYVSMTDPARAQTVDTDIAKHCAYSLPGVALTLGRQNWHCLKDTYETLASDVQWKVRRTLAFSIHELAVILGDQLTAADLLPIFNGFLKDLDEVRIGVLKHLYDFLKLLHEDKRREYLYQLQEFVVTDNSRNWRFRYELAEQLILILELYNPNDVYDYLTHLALKLCADKVSEVRWISFKLVVAILQKFYSNSESALGLNFINELILRFRHCSKWVGRQAFAFICQAVVREECIPVDQFVEHLLPSLLSLASDPVPNVRVLLAKALRQTLLEKAYFRNAGNPHLEVVEETVFALQSDQDQDVSFFATLEPKKRNSIDPTMLEKQD